MVNGQAFSWPQARILISVKAICLSHVKLTFRWLSTFSLQKDIIRPMATRKVMLHLTVKLASGWSTVFQNIQITSKMAMGTLIAEECMDRCFSVLLLTHHKWTQLVCNCDTLIHMFMIQICRDQWHNNSQMWISCCKVCSFTFLYSFDVFKYLCAPLKYVDGTKLCILLCST